MEALCVGVTHLEVLREPVTAVRICKRQVVGRSHEPERSGLLAQGLEAGDPPAVLRLEYGHVLRQPVTAPVAFVQELEGVAFVEERPAADVVDREVALVGGRAPPLRDSFRVNATACASARLRGSDTRPWPRHPEVAQERFGS
jgi:hypothetical protein